VSALTAGVLSVVATPAANAVTGTLVGRVYENITSDGAAVVSATTLNNGSQGLISVSAAVSGAQTVSMYSNGIVVVATTSVITGQSVTVSAGGILTPSAGSADCFKTGSGTLSYTGSSPAATAAILAADAGAGRIFCAVRATKPGTTFTITINEAVLATTTSVITVNVLNSAYNAAAGGTYVNSATNTSQRSQGVIAWGTGTGLSQTASMYSSGILSTQTAVAGSSVAQKITVTGGTIAGADKCLVAGSAGTLAVASDLTNCSATANAATQLFASIKPSAAGTALIITGYNDATTDGYVASWKITVTVVAPGSAGSFSASDSNIGLTAGGGAPATANVDSVGAAVAENAACVELSYTLNDALGLPLTGSSIIAKASNSGMALTLGGTSGTLAVVTGAYGGSVSYVSACQNAANANKPLSGTITLTVDGVDVATRSILIVGQLATITVVEGAIAARADGGSTDTIYGVFETIATTGTWFPSHAVTGADSAGNLVPVTVAVDTTTLDAQVTNIGDIKAALPRDADSDLRTGGLTFACADTSGSNAKLKVKATAADTTTIYSNVFNVTCAGAPVNYTASTDKAVYNTGDVMTVTLSFTDKSGKAANDFALISKASYVGTIASGAIASTVTGPSSAATGEAATSGKKAYKYIVGQDTGSYSMAVDFPNVNNTTYKQAAITVPVTVASATTVVSNADVLKSIVALIASINKQIQALQKLILKR
jgi:hypothetical protein